MLRKTTYVMNSLSPRKGSNRKTMMLAVSVFVLAALFLVGGRPASASSMNFITSLSGYIVEIVGPVFDTAPEVMAVETWSGGDGNDALWTSNDNWSGIGGADPGDDLFFPAVASRLTNNNDFAVGTSFSSLNFAGNSYVISGNRIALTDGIVNNPSGGGNPPIFNPDIQLSANQTFSSAVSHVELNGIINLNGQVLTLTGAGNHRLDNQVAGGVAGSLMHKNGSGTAIFSGNSPSAPTIIVNAGTMRVDSGAFYGGIVDLNAAILSGTGTVGGINANTASGANTGTISPGQNPGNAGILSTTGFVVFSPTSTYAVDINGPAQFDQLNVTGDNVGLSGANLDISLGSTPAIGDQFTIITQVGNGDVIGQFAQGTSIVVEGQVFAITYNASGVVLTAQGPFTGLTWDGGGSTNNWSEAANWNPNIAPVDGVDLVFPSGVPADSLDNANNIIGLDVRSLTFTGQNYDITGNAITLSHGVTTNVVGGVDFRPNITLVASQTFASNGSSGSLSVDGQLNMQTFGLTVDGVGAHDFFGQVTGTAGIVKSGAGTLILAGNNTYAGTTQINNGVVSIDQSNSLGTTGAGNNTIVAAGASLEIRFNSLNVPEAITLNGNGVGGNGALRTLACPAGCSISGPITLAGNSTINSAINGLPDALTLSGTITGSGTGITKTGVGTLTLSASNTYTGTTTVIAGTLLVNGNSGSSAVNLSGGKLGGTGTVGPLTATGGTVAPGNSPGHLSAFASSTFNAATTLNIEIGGTAPSTYDRFLVNSPASTTMNLGGANLSGTLINGFIPTAGQQFTIVTTQIVGLTGQFAQGTSVNISGRRFNIAYDSHSVVLTAQTAGKAPVDFDGDGKTDISIFRPGPAEWWYVRSSDGQVPAAQFGTGSDRIVPGDFTGDGKTDIAFWRPSTGQWFVLRSEDGSFFAFPFGQNGDIPAPADYDGDGKTDVAVFRPSVATWFILRSNGSGTAIVQFGAAGDLPVPADYDGDGKADVAIWRQNGGEWWYLRSTDNQVFSTTFGISTDKPVQGDFTGDGKADIAVFRGSNGTWFVLRSEDLSFFSFPFGSNGDIAAPGDYDGDGKYDAGVFRPNVSTWFVNRSTAGSLIQQFGSPGDVPLPSAFIP